ncbi:sorting nexin-14 [Harpegnathos saltator]|uniref:Sorting nexin-14 n=1 Tax=Harpegnathos saltator TaxID=610380 RepID=E2B9W5_HARSA|nr:sorting nexin-14 [Harpegnathos saltator]EFN87552.1 Sorting nexin-14 [Harpegnathos saltator]
MQDLYYFNITASATIVLFAAFILVVFQSIAWTFLVVIIYGITSFYTVQFLQIIDSLLTRFNITSDTFITKAKQDLCTVCSNVCKRHKLLPHSTKVKVPKDFDHALEQLLEEILQIYVCTWYSDFSTNEAFIQQLRLAITTAAKNIADRLLRADTATIIFHDLIPLAIQHARDWNMLNKKSKSEVRMPQDYIGSYLGSKIHPAAYSRKAELNYLRGLVTALLPHLLPAIHISTNNKIILREILSNWVLLPAIDALADPENINMLVTLSTHRDTSLSDAAETINVPMLQSWVTIPVMHPHITQSCFKQSLDEILNNPELLYMFMQHIKETGPMNLLQFCLDIDDLSKRMLNPEMSTNAEENLYIDVQTMYAVYLDPDGPEYLYLPLHISKGIQQILEGGPEKIQELRTSRPFYQAHQEAHALLESTCLPSFHHSYQLYKYLCGHLVSEQAKTTAINASGSICTPIRFSNQLGKIDGVVRTSTMDGGPFQLQDAYPVEEVDCTARAYNEIKGFGDKSHRDLTAWRVAIPHVDGSGAQPVYTIAVHSVAEAKSWVVRRQDQDFYTLRTRLTEFHGDKELNDSPLPSRKNPHLSLTTNRQRYEEFLQKLLSKPMLRSSELLYTFLTTPNLKPYYANYSTPDIGILYQSMAYKLRKEKGQHLDKFMSTFLASTNTKYEHMDMGVEPSSEHNLSEAENRDRRLLDGVFGNNLNLPVAFQNFPCSLPQRDHMKGASLCIVEAVDGLLNVPPVILQLFWIFGSLSCKRLDPVVNTMFYNVLVKLLSGGRAAIVVKLLHAKVVGDKSYIKDFSSQEKDYYDTAKEGLHSLLPWWLIGVSKPWSKLMDSLLDPLQNAPFNKHLAYFLLDHLLVNLFPELTA